MSADLVYELTSIGMPPRRETRAPSVDYPGRAELVEALVGVHATLTVVGSAWETGGGWQRLRLLQWAHALEPLARVHWETPRRYIRPVSPNWIVTNRDAWREVAMRADLAIEMDRGLA